MGSVTNGYAAFPELAELQCMKSNYPEAAPLDRPSGKTTYMERCPMSPVMPTTSHLSLRGLGSRHASEEAFKRSSAPAAV